MKIDTRTLANGQILEADLGIIGAGPAGLSVAREFAATGLQVAILESGGLAHDPMTQALCDGQVVGDPYAGPLVTRRRQVGGTANEWNTHTTAECGAKYVPLDPLDFLARSWLPVSGWPLDWGDLAPYYVRAHHVCGLGPFTYRAADWADPDCGPLPLNSNVLANAVYLFGPGRLFTGTYVAETVAAPNLRLFLHANAVALESDPAGAHVAQVRIRCLSGSEHWLRARAFVLAAGGIENARLLLLSEAAGRVGPGNEHDWVGRCFMEHPRDMACAVVPRNPALLERLAFYAMHTTSQGSVMGRLALTEAAMASERLMNASITLIPPDRVARSRTKQALRGMLAVGLPWLRAEPLPLLINLEQAPDPANRVALSVQRDALGLPKVQIEWRWREHDQRNLRRLRATLGGALEDAGFGLFVTNHNAPPDPNAHHHLGTTRMHPDPHYGVVDTDSRVHGTENLFVAGSSVFPTGGYANPTLTVIALSLRLADHLKSLLVDRRMHAAAPAHLHVRETAAPAALAADPVCPDAHVGVRPGKLYANYDRHLHPQPEQPAAGNP